MFAKESENFSQMSPTEYLVWEEQQEGKYEYVDGVITAMTGGTVPHNDLALNLFLEIYPEFSKKGCKVNVADVKLNITETKYYYPDIMATCHPEDLTAIDAMRNPILLVEVLSATTSDKDRGEKKNKYFKIPSLQEYILIDSEQIAVEHYIKGEGRMWLYSLLEEGDILSLKSINLDIPIEKIYKNFITSPKFEKSL